MADLDPRQRAAVDAGMVDVFVTAGAGSGKTRVLSRRFVAAVLGEPPYEPCRPDELVAVTFTEKAAGELAERVRGELNAAGATAAARSIADAWISTIHGMCSKILRQYALIAGVDPHFAVLDQVAASALEAEALESTLREMLPADASLRELLDLYGPAEVLDGARMLRSNMHALGRQMTAAGLVGISEASKRLQEARQALVVLPAEFAALRQTKTVEGNASAVRAVADALQDADIERSLATLCGCSLRHLSGVEGHDELVDDALMWIERARQAAAQMLVDRQEQALLAFAAALDERYRVLKGERGALDFEDLQVKTAELLEEHPEVASAFRKRFAMVMLDEFQDTNELQMRIVSQLTEGNLCTVGDENQSIYAFRHADVEVFRARGRCTEQHLPLDTNYRTAPALLDALNGLFSHPALLGPDFLRLQAPETEGERREWPAGEARAQMRFIDVSEKDGSDPQEIEAQRVAERVAELMAAGVPSGDIAVLMRAMRGGRAAKVEEQLLARGIPVHVAGGGSFFDRSEVIEARALLRCVANVLDDEALTTVLAGHLTALSPDTLVALRVLADEIASEEEGRGPGRLWEAAASGRLACEAADASALERTVAVIGTARSRLGTRPLADTVLEPLLALDADLVLLSAQRGGVRAWSNLEKLARMAGEFEMATGGDLGGFLEYLELREVHASAEPEAVVEVESSAVRVMSIHSAKGLEFPAVIVAGLSAPSEGGPILFGRVDGRPMLGMTLPRDGKTLQTMGSSLLLSAARQATEAESVRLLYVACTRAEESLTLVARTDSTKEAGSSLGDRARTALGLGGAGMPDSATIAVGDGEVYVTLLPSMLSESPAVENRPAPLCEGRSRTTTAPSGQPSPSAARSGVPPRVSYSGLATYSRCPRRFFLSSMAHLPAPPEARGGAALAFGNALHDVLERCRTASDDPERWVKAASLAAGLETSEEPRLLAAAEAFLRSPLAAEVFASDSVMREAAIAVPVAQTVLAGSIDCIAWNGDEALVVDYKTGSGPLSFEQARDRYLLQASCYALAAFRAGACRVRVVFAEVERGREVPYEFSADEASGAEARVLAILEQMSAEGFERHADYDAQLCETCPGLGGPCPVTRPKRGDAA